MFMAPRRTMEAMEKDVLNNRVGGFPHHSHAEKTVSLRHHPVRDGDLPGCGYRIRAPTPSIRVGLHLEGSGRRGGLLLRQGPTDGVWGEWYGYPHSSRLHRAELSQPHAVARREVSAT